MSDADADADADADVVVVAPAAEEVKGLDANEMNIEPVIKLVACDVKEDEGIPVFKKYVKMSTLIHSSVSDDKEATFLPLPSVTQKILKIVVEYIEHHKGVSQEIIPKPLKSKVMKEVCKDPWDAELIDKLLKTDKQALYDVILAANYLDMQDLLHLGCAKVASIIKGQPLEKIKDILNPNIASEEEEKKEEDGKNN